MKEPPLVVGTRVSVHSVTMLCINRKYATVTGVYPCYYAIPNHPNHGYGYHIAFEDVRYRDVPEHQRDILNPNNQPEDMLITAKVHESLVGEVLTPVHCFLGHAIKVRL